MQVIHLDEKFNLFTDHWHPHIVGEVNNSFVKLAKLHGELVWHHHADEDELFLVVKGHLVIRLPDGELNLHPGDLAIISKGVEHYPVAEEEVHVLLIEPKSTLHTGNVKNERTVETQDWI